MTLETDLVRGINTLALQLPTGRRLEGGECRAALGLHPHHSATFSEFWRAPCLSCRQEPEKTALPLIAFVFLNGSFKKLFSRVAVGHR